MYKSGDFEIESTRRSPTRSHPDGSAPIPASAGRDAWSRILRTATQNEEIIDGDIRIAAHERDLLLGQIGDGLGIPVVDIGPAEGGEALLQGCVVPRPCYRR